MKKKKKLNKKLQVYHKHFDDPLPFIINTPQVLRSSTNDGFKWLEVL